ncbi:SsgA family sporulation/cell division regulator [Streptomyces roseicoloratus]|uniref:SsgA family sporulation/cell division regulator n=1 Tax=Streptomyces roseicoloratus TaxID=2508722 RepID=A0ABY9RT70_9ACTN|nr:SsgA family sporulation/cell division regulator [Streptomyces roseicoloratus]WMX44429.1 SsgA family sporulation/cell division regulator [Streptomyces roseicoloratus]
MSEPRRRGENGRAWPATEPTVAPWRTTGRRVHADLEFPIEVGFSYDPDDPWAVLVGFGRGEHAVEWTLSRELLHRGTRTPCGEGDVQFWPLRQGGRDGRLRIRLGGTGVPVLVDVDRSALRAWLAKTFEAVPAGTEATHIDWEAEAAHIGWV